MTSGATFTIHPLYYETRLFPHINSEIDICFAIDKTYVRGSGALVEAASDYLRSVLTVTAMTETNGHKCKRLKFEMCQQSLLMILQLLSDGTILVRRPAYCLKLIEALLTLHIGKISRILYISPLLINSPIFCNTVYTIFTNLNVALMDQRRC